jgi:plasmid stabilization system protein ParE
MRDAMTFILQEDDGYRFRVQWCAGLIPRWAKMKHFLYACTFLEHAEIVGDMKERIRLLRRVLKTIVEDPRMCQLAEEFMREVDWKKVKLSKADKYYFRAKYFKVDYPYYQY